MISVKLETINIKSDDMNTSEVMNLMNRIHKENVISCDKALLSEEKLDAIFNELNLTYKQLMRKLTFDFIDIAGVTTITPEWKFMVLNFYCLHLLNNSLKKDELISVAQTKDLKNHVLTMVHVGILQNLHPKLPHFKPLRSNEIGIESQYYMLKATVCGLFKYTFLPTLRYHIMPQTIKGLLVALFQLAYCPIKKPSSSKEGNFVMTEEFYGELLGDQDRFQGFLETIRTTVSPGIYFKEIMILFRANCPKWFKKAVSATLTMCIKREDGLENILKVMLAGTYDNNTTIWKVIEAITQIVISTVHSCDFNTCISPQVDNLLIEARQCPSRDSIALEKLYASIVKAAYSCKAELTQTFVNKLLIPITELSTGNESLYQDGVLFGQHIQQTVRVIHYIFLDTKDVPIPMVTLTPFMTTLLKIYIFIYDSDLAVVKSDLYDIAQQYLIAAERLVVYSLFENVLFGLTLPNLSDFRKDVVVSTKGNNLFVEFSNTNNIKCDIIKSAHSIYPICKSNTKLFHLYFGFLLNCLCNFEKYFTDMSLLESEDQGNLSSFERKVAIYEMLSILAADGMTKKYFTEKIPEEMLDYFNQVLVSSIKTGSHKDQNELVFTVAMILEDVARTKQCDLEQSDIMNSIRTIIDETSNAELKALLNKIVDSSKINSTETMEKDEVEKAIQETYDESIPVKGHGLIALEKLVCSKHPRAVERKQYIFTVFKENLSNRDTYIYQSSIKGLASVADLGMECTSMVLETLCDEYADFRKDEFGTDADEMRLKIGEVLVQVSKKLGEMAPTYKALLLNTFLNATKDEDPLIRASALANLGEICKVLGYRLGTIVTEILMCVHAIINTDKSPEAKRAAVQVLRDLLIGLGTDMLPTLKDDILVCYRTLKFLYENDKDDVVKLHAQLAIEELNKNMKDIIFPQIDMDTENKVVVLK